VRNRKAGLHVLLLCALPLAAQTGSGKLANVEGTTTSALTGALIPRVHVTLQGESQGESAQYATTSGIDGKFSITGIAPGSYSLTGNRVGFVRRDDAVRFALKAGDIKTGIAIKLTPTGAIAGRVTDEDGEPVEGVTVFAEGRVGDYVTTDEKGQFRIGGLVPGRYHVKASHEDTWDGKPEIRTDGTVDMHTVTTWYPNALTENDAGTVVVQPAGETGGIEIQLVRVPFVRVSGKVVGLDSGAERPLITVSQGIGGNGSELKPDGSFEIWRLDPGKYRLSAEWTAPNGEHVETAGAEVEVAGSNIDNIELRVVAASDISGRLEFEDDQVKQMIPKTIPGPFVELFQMGAAAGNAGSPRVDSNGTFRLEKVPPGKYWLGFSDEKLYVKSMRLGSKEIDGAVLDLTNGSVGADLSLVLSTATGSISGTVLDSEGKAAAGALVVLTEAGPETGFDARMATAGAEGAYTFANLPPGSYKLVAMEERNPAIRENNVIGYDQLTEVVEVETDARVTKNLKRRMPDERWEQ
jgi:Carboxypeptidase regulatory-like domain